MWRKGKKRKDDDEPAGGSDDSSKKSDDLLVSKLSKNRRVAVGLWQGKPVVDIREFYTKDGKELPGKKGISLPIDQWSILREHVDKIDEAMAENS